MDAVEGEYEVVAAVSWYLLAARLEDLDVTQTQCVAAAARRSDRMFRQVVTVKRRSGKRRSEHLEHKPSAAADIGDQRTAFELGQHTIKRRNDDGYNQHLGPRPEHALDVMRALDTEVVIRKAEAGMERGHESIEETDGARHLHRCRRERDLTLAGEDQSTDRRELEAVDSTVIHVGNEPRRGLRAQPLEHPTGMSVGTRREFISAKRPGAVHRAIVAEAVTELDRQCHHLALFVSPDDTREGLQLLQVDAHGLSRIIHRGPRFLPRAVHHGSDPIDDRGVTAPSKENIIGPQFRNRIDDALDATIVFSFTNVGYHVRQRLQQWSPLAAMPGRRVLVTGANSGIGFAAAQRFAELGAIVHLGVRDSERGSDAAARILEKTPAAELHVEQLDMSDLDAVRAFAARFENSTGALDVLVHNAGALLHERSVTAQGIETTLATHVVGPFLLTSLLLPTLSRSSDARVIAVTSGGMYSTGLSLADLEDDPSEYNGTHAYAHAKRMQILLTEEWAERTANTTVTFHAMHPGWTDTPGVATALPRFRRVVGPFLRSPDQGADTVVWLGSDAGVAHQSGGLWLDRRQRAPHKLRRTRAGDRDRAALFAEIGRLSDSPSLL